MLKFFAVIGLEMNDPRHNLTPIHIIDRFDKLFNVR